MDLVKGLAFSISRTKEDFTTAVPLRITDLSSGSIMIIKDYTEKYDEYCNYDIFTNLIYANLSGSNGSIVTNKCHRLVTKDILYSQNGIGLFNEKNIRFYICYYDKAGNFLNNSGWKCQDYFEIPNNTYYRIQFAYNETRDTTRLELIHIKDVIENISINSKEILFNGFRNGSGFNTSNEYAVTNTNIIPTYDFDDIQISILSPTIPDDAIVRYQLATYTINSGYTSSNRSNAVVTDDNRYMSNGLINIGDVVKNSKGFAVSLYFLKPQDGTYVPIRITDNPIIKILYKRSAIKKQVYYDYLLDSSLQKTPLKIKALGSLTYMQSFLIRNDNYYSTDGSNIAVQDTDFNLISDTQINIGHGNSLQLGNDGYAYASGWNDNKIYKIDLDTLTVISEISLPTTGYTTSAIDTDRGLVYIFRRSDTPSTDASYDFIVYDYINSNIISNKTNKTVPFGAMQACDYYEDRIIVLNGIGVKQSPLNCIRVYNTSGDIISTYHLNSLEAEYEGVCLDRHTGDLFISTSSFNKVFKIYI